MTSMPETPDEAPEGTTTPPETTEPEAAESAAPVVDDAVVEAAAIPDPDPRLLAAHDLALGALREITAASSVGPAAGYTVEPDGAVSLRFENRLPGYPGWYWTVSIAVVEGAEPTVLEVELLPGDGALLAPEWVPWATRLAEYHAQQALLAEAAGDASEDADDESDDDEDEDSDEDEDEDEDAADFREDGSPILHAGDVDGVDIDELDEDADDPDDEDDSDEDDSDEDDEDEDDEDDDSDDADDRR